MHETDPPKTRWLLQRIAATLDVVPDAFRSATHRAPAGDAGPTQAECDEAALLFRSIELPDRRTAVLKLMREMASHR